MPPRHQIFRTLYFKGPRFEDHRLGIDDLAELKAWKDTIFEVAKERWRSAHPERSRLPNRFLEDVELRIGGLVPGSTGVAIMRSTGEAEEGLPLGFEDELDELEDAVRQLEVVVECAGADKPFPDGISADVIDVVLERGFGSTLREGDSLEWACGAAGGKDLVRYTQESRARIAGWVADTYEDEIDLIGEVREVDLDRARFNLRLGPEHDEARVAGSFKGRAEAELVEALRDHETRRLRVIGRGSFRSRDGALAKILSVDRFELLPLSGKAFNENARPHWEVIAEIGAQIPDEEWARFPSDMSERIDEVVYGAPGERA